MKVRIESDGTVVGTNIINTDTGEVLPFVQEVVLKISAEEQRCSLTCMDVASLFEGEAEVLLQTKLSVFDMQNMIRGALRLDAEAGKFDIDEMGGIEDPALLMKIYQRYLRDRNLVRNSRKFAESLCELPTNVVGSLDKKEETYD